METHFAPAEREDRVAIKEEYQQLRSMEFLVNVSEATNTMFMVLNNKRQLIYANQKLLTLLKADHEHLLGQRPGEMLVCKNAQNDTGGCGTQNPCRKCGAINAILAAIEGKMQENECRISSLINGKNVSFDLLVKATPFDYNDKRYVLFSVADISDAKRKEVLERTFLHDILNTAGGVYGFSELLKEDVKSIDQDLYEKITTINELSDALVQEIKNHQRLRAAENNDLILDVTEIYLSKFLDDVVNILKRNKSLDQREVKILNQPDIKIKSDRVLLQRVLINMIKNAAEASEIGQSVLVDVKEDKDQIIFSVNNLKYIEKDIQQQIFQRSFSTKGKNRGIGTYSMKLFGENYLKGKVWFESNHMEGTTFYLSIPKEIRDDFVESIN